MKIIHLDAEDDIHSICDRLDWSGAEQVLFVLPEVNGGLKGLDFVRLRRFADRRRIEIGVVAQDESVRRQAQALGIPAFRSEPAAGNRRRWWRGRRRKERVGLPTVGGGLIAERTQPLGGMFFQQVGKERSTPAQPQLRQWGVRYLAILLFCIALSLLYVGFTFAVPGATVTLKPETVPLAIEQIIVADPFLPDIDYDGKQMPGRVLAVEMMWQAEVEASGTVDVPTAPARGAVLFVNVTADEVVIPVGTRISASDGSGTEFETVAEVILPDVEGSTAEVDVVAVEPGPQGNVDAGSVQLLPEALSSQVEVRNPEPMTGGGVRQEPAVSETDMSRLHSQVVQFLQALAASEMEAQLTENEFLTRDSLRIERILRESYSHAVGEQTARLSLEMHALLHGTAVNTTEASGLAYETLIQTVPDAHTLLPDSIRFQAGEVLGADEAGRVTFVMNAAGQAAADLDITALVETIAGHDAETAVAYLNQSLPLQAPPTITVWPVWFDRVPYAPARVQVEVAP